MKVLEHWHPIFISEELRQEPVLVQLNGTEIVIFRTEAGAVGALEDRCPHRRMRLSRGRVRGENLECAYHGWRYAADGTGHSPGNPELQVCATHFDVVEREGAVWVKAASSDADFPIFDVDGFEYIASQHYSIASPMELVLDNFTEVEHTGGTHALLGYMSERMNEVVVEVESTERTVRVQNFGPQKKIPWIVERLFGIRTGDIFVDDWTTHFSPVYTQYEHWWKEAATDRPRPDHLRTFVVFVPEDSEHTSLFVFAYARSGRRSAFMQRWILNPLTRRLLRLEVSLDIQMIEALADKNTDLAGMRLSRFDRVLGLNRSRIRSIYYGDDSG